MFDNSSSHRLVGKFFTNSTLPSFEETENSLRQQWNLSGDMMTVQKQNHNDTFLFKFRQENDKVKILENRPFNVNGVILVLKDPNTSNMIDFTVASFNVQVVGLPSYLYTEKILLDFKSVVGEINPVLLGPHKGSIHYRVEVDLNKPLRPGFYIANRFVQFIYSNLGDFCYKCGRIGHVEICCDHVRFPKERALNATSRTQVYGPWLRVSSWDNCYVLAPMKSPNDARECEKTLSYAQFFIELEFNNVFVCYPRFKSKTKSTHRFRFPCSYLDTETEPTDFTTTSKAYEVIVKEIFENTPFSLGDVGPKSLNSNWHDVMERLVEELKLAKENAFSCDDKWLTLKLKFNRISKFTHVDYETMLAINEDIKCEGSIESEISDLIKKRVQKNEDLVSLSFWENQFREVLSKMGLSTRYMHVASGRAKKAMMEAIQMEISSSSCPKPADKSMVSGLERFKVLGPHMDRLDPCVICDGEMFLAEDATVLPCSHVFHRSCIEKWFQVGHKCPLCGFKLLSQK